MSDSHAPIPTPEALTETVSIIPDTITETTPPAPEAIPTTYRWTYADQAAHEKAVAAKKNRRGILTFSIVLSGVFLISFVGCRCTFFTSYSVYV